MLQKVMSLFKTHATAQHKHELYDYQLEISYKIFKALIQNLQLTSAATEEDIKKLSLEEIPVEISRQAGKTTDVVDTVEFIMVFLTELFGRPIAIGIFAPQHEQAKTDFDRLKASLLRSQKDLKVYEAAADDIDKAKGESNAKTIVLPNGSSCYIFPVTPTSKPESKTLDLIIFEESQDIDDKILKEQIWPMGASTNAPRVYIGTAGTKICYFYRLGQQSNALKLYYPEIVAQRRKKYLETGNALHLVYEQTVKQEIALSGLDSDEIQRPYFGKWLIGTGQFTTQEDLEGLIGDRKRTYQDKQSQCFAGIDTAKHPDSTVVTILRFNPEKKRKEVLNWLELRGENYQTQFDIILEFLSKYNVQALAIDTTGGGGAFMPDMFEVHSNWRDDNSGLYRVTFSAPTKSNMFVNLKVSIRELLTDLPKLDTREGERFKQQMLDLQQEWKGQNLSVHHPKDAHDDYPDSWALAEWAYARWNESRITVALADATPERQVEKDEAGKVTNYWPGGDDYF
jgi:hypothetical protein